MGVCVPAADAISATPKLNCGSCRVLARLRRRRYCWHIHRLTLRFRSLAGARQLPQGIGFVDEICVPAADAISATPKLNCGSCRAPARLRRRRHGWHFIRLTHRYRCLAKARQLPHGIGCVSWICAPAAVAFQQLAYQATPTSTTPPFNRTGHTRKRWSGASRHCPSSRR